MIHDLAEHFDDRNMFLLAILGLLSVRENLLALVDEYGKSVAPAPVAPAERIAEDHFLHAVLGVLSLTATVAGHAARAVPAESVEGPPVPAAPLRRLLV